jgi:hypothetical protein
MSRIAIIGMLSALTERGLMIAAVAGNAIAWAFLAIRLWNCSCH